MLADALSPMRAHVLVEKHSTRGIRVSSAGSAAALTGSVEDIPLGCMVARSSVGSEGHSELGKLVRSERAATLDRLKARLSQGVVAGEISASTDVHALARFMQTVQNGMLILARDGASRAELEAVAQVAMLGWEARTRS